MSDVPDYLFVQSAVIPFRVRDGKVEILLITSRKKRRWVIPKGVKEPDLSAPDSAAKEALEEAGIEGEVSEHPIGCYEYRKWGGTCHVEVFVMAVQTVHEEWLESIATANGASLMRPQERVTEKKLKQLIRSLPAFLDTNGVRVKTR